MTKMLALTRFILVVFWAFSNVIAYAANTVPWDTTLSTGIAYRQQGKLQLSIDLLTQARQTAGNDKDRMRAAGELGATQLQARRLDQADASLHEAYAFFTGSDRARYALDLGNLAVIRNHHKDAQTYYEEALKLSSNNAGIHASADLNLTRLAPETERLGKLKTLFHEIGDINNANISAGLYLNLGDQARKLGKPALELAYESIDKSRQLSAKLTPANPRLHAETLDSLAQLYEDQGRTKDALTLTQQAIAQAHALPPGAAGDLLINLEWRQGRLQKTFNQNDLALAAYQRAVDQIESIRQDIPIDYEDGNSSFSTTLNPIYLGLVDLLLQQPEMQSGEARSLSLRQARDTVELIKQSELQDYLGDRCTVDTVKGGSETIIPAGTAILYPIIFNDRIDLLFESNAGIVRYSTKISGTVVRQTAVGFANALRNGSAGYMLNAQQLYDWLFRPFETLAAEQHINDLVVVPDGALRLVAMGALHDGKQFAIEKFAISTVTGLSMTNTNRPPSSGLGFLVAGMSVPGPVVDKLSQNTVDQIFGADNKEASRGLTQNRSMRSLRSVSLRSVGSGDPVTRSAALRDALSLPGVKQEIDAIGQIVHSTSLLNSAFTVGDFRKQAETGQYRMMHVASHGVFGGTADTSYILAYDDLLTLDGLQSLLKSDSFRKNPIELLSLSACETAEGDDRSPLGISGAAIKARAKSVLGTLWPVEDNAARKVMESFYRGIATNHLTKAEALRQAQIELLKTDEFSHPLFWGPFVLIGNWL